MTTRYLVALAAVIGIITIETVALIKGVNGLTLASSIGGISALGSFALGRILKK